MEQKKISVGRHTIFSEGDDLIFVVSVGDVAEEEAKQIMEFGKEFGKGKPYIFQMVDVRQGGNVLPGARKAFAAIGEDSRLRGMVFFGASFQVRLMVNLISNAAKLFSKQQENPTHFCKDEAEARAWIEARRKFLDAKLNP